VPLVERVKIQAELLIPLVKALEKELGVDRAHDLVREALGGHYRRLASLWAAQRGSMGAMETFVSISTSGGALDLADEVTSATDMAFDVTGCRYADFFRAIGEAELGFLLVCTSDFALADGMPGVTLERTQTIMQGATRCDFRFDFDPAALTVVDGSYQQRR
jgi:L-2-amino-thiazoline-4-carboxylic acid hydrolase